MKICKFCGAKTKNLVMRCLSCGSNEFKYICSNCKTAFESGFCPNCGVKAGDEGRICPDCGTHFFSVCCPSCGYSIAPRSSGDKEGYDFPDGTYDTSPIETGGAMRSIFSSLLPVTSFLRSFSNKLVFVVCLVFGLWALICGGWLLIKGTLLRTIIGGVLIVIACVLLIVGFKKRKGR